MGLRSHTAIWASIVLLVFFLIGHYFIDHDRARIVANSLTVGVYLAVMLTWFRKFRGAVVRGIKDGTDNIFVGIWVNAFVMVSYLVYIAVLIALDLREWARVQPIGGIFTVLFFLSGASLYLAPVNTQEEIEPVSLRWWLAAGIIGGMVAGVIMTLAFLGIVGFA